MIKHPWFEYGVDLVLVLNSILLMVESAEALSGHGALKPGHTGTQVGGAYESPRNLV